MTLNSESTYPLRRTRRLELRSEAGLDAFAGPFENPVSEQQSSFTELKVLLDSIVRALKGSGNPRSAKELAKAFARISTQRMVRLWSRANPTGITIRAVRPDDRERIVKAFRALDSESIRKRFFGPKKALSDEELLRLTESDGVRDVVLVATVASVDQEIIVGLGHYARNGASAEIAFTVEEDYQGHGIATELLRQLIEIARRSGVLRFEADVLHDNAPMLKVFHRSGLPMKKTHADGIVHLTLFLDDGPGSA